MRRDHMAQNIQVLDHGYVRFIEAWGHGEAGNGNAGDGSPGPDDNEVGIIEAARMSTQKSFLGWEDHKCTTCLGTGDMGYKGTVDASFLSPCQDCNGKGIIPGDKKLF